MNLYHGTLAANVPSILKNGLKPRGRSRSHDSYLGSPSLPQFVYLTSRINVAFDHAVRISERVHNGAPVCLVTVDMDTLDENLLYPDEDFLELEWDSELGSYNLATKLAYMERHRLEWEESLLDGTRTVAYRGVIKPVTLWEDEHGVEDYHRKKRHQSDAAALAYRQKQLKLQVAQQLAAQQLTAHTGRKKHGERS